MARQRIGRYDILESVGSGGFAIVYRAQDTQLGRAVALKVLHPHMTGDSQYLDRFLREARLAASIPTHPNVVVLHEVGQEGNTYFIAKKGWQDGNVDAPELVNLKHLLSATE